MGCFSCATCEDIDDCDEPSCRSWGNKEVVSAYKQAWWLRTCVNKFLLFQFFAEILNLHVLQTSLFSIFPYHPFFPFPIFPCHQVLGRKSSR